jgi:hypothetical protein
MTFLHEKGILQSPALEGLRQFILEWEKQWAIGTPDFENYEHELHQRVMAIERELLATELARYDVTAKQIEVEGVKYRHTLTSTETYLTTAGEVTVSRNLYSPAGRGHKSICPMELRVGVIGGYWTPRAARQGAFVVAQVTPGQGEVLFEELGGMGPSRSSLDRLPKALSPHWEAHRQQWEAALRTQETVPSEASVLVMSVDGVMVRMKGSQRQAKREQPGKHASGPTGQKEAGCGTVVLYDAEGERLQTVRYGRMPERKKLTLQHQLETEVASVLAVRPDLKRVLLSDGAKDNWRLLAEVDQACGPPPQPSVEIVDFCHACDHLKEGCDAAWGESTPRSKAEFERLKVLLKEEDDGAERVIRVLKYHRGRTRGRTRERLETQLTYFRNQRHRMHYAQYLRNGLPIASGVMEAACKTLVTQRLKQSGMIWTRTGGQPILTLRSLIQSDRWQPAWKLLRTDFCKTVTVCQVQETSPPVAWAERSYVQLAAKIFSHSHCTALPLAVQT